MVDVKILVMTNPLELERTIEEAISYKYCLTGAVTVGVNSNGNTIYVATLVREEK